jgi:hypothetical protein
MVGQLPLEQHIGVRIPGGQPVPRLLYSHNHLTLNEILFFRPPSWPPFGPVLDYSVQIGFSIGCCGHHSLKKSQLSREIANQSRKDG